MEVSEEFGDVVMDEELPDGTGKNEINGTMTKGTKIRDKGNDTFVASIVEGINDETAAIEARTHGLADIDVMLSNGGGNPGCSGEKKRE